MAQRCRRCEQLESKEAALRERRLVLWRRGMLTEVLSQELEAELRGLTEELERHQAAYHQESIYC
jgi:hypothetical protein